VNVIYPAIVSQLLVVIVPLAAAAALVYTFAH
jgi:hypothetical protein